MSSKYAIIYQDSEGEQWTYTSCKFFDSRDDAIAHFLYKDARIICTLKVKLKATEQV